MKDTIDRIQNWYKLNCNGDWEHNYGYSIATLDNPGWTVRIDLRETPLEKLDFQQNHQNPNYEHDWFQIKTESQVLQIFCGPDNLNQVFQIFFDNILPNHSDKKFFYDIYLPLTGHHYDIWTPAKAAFVNEERVKLTEIRKPEYKAIKVRDINQIDFDQTVLDKLKLKHQIGEVVEVALESVFDGPILTAKSNK